MPTSADIDVGLRQLLDSDSYYDADMYEILRREDGSPPFTIEGVIHPWGSMLTGLEGSGKSFVVASFTWALATNQGEWCGRRINADRDLTIEVICTDINGDAEYAHRWNQFGGSLNLRAMTLPDESVDWEKLTTFLKARGVDVVVFDNLMGLHEYDGEDIKENKDAGPIVRGLKKITSEGITPVLVHHTSDTGEDRRYRQRNRRAMGAKKYTQWARHVVTLDDVGGDQRTITVHKSNYWQAGEVIHLKFRPGEPELGPRMVEEDTEGPTRATARKRERDSETYDRNAEIADWIVEHCQGKGRDKTAEAIADKFNEKVGTAKVCLSEGRKYGAMVTWTGRGDSRQWALK